MKGRLILALCAFLLWGVLGAAHDSSIEQKVYLPHCPSGWFISYSETEDDFPDVDVLVMHCTPPEEHGVD